MKDGNVHQLPQPLFDDEAVGRLDIFQIDAAEAGPQIAHAIDERVDVRRVHFDVDRIDIGETLEQHGLAFHHGLGGQRPQIAQAQNRRAVGNHGHEIAFGRVIEHGIRPLGDRTHGHGHAGRIGEA